jgi:hypothetical protein
MCDCYEGLCKFCGNRIDAHIADFCIPREDVDMVCHVCTSKLKYGYESEKPIDQMLANLGDEGLCYEKVFVDFIESQGQIIDAITEKEIGEIGRPVLFLTNNQSAYGLRLN